MLKSNSLSRTCRGHAAFGSSGAGSGAFNFLEGCRLNDYPLPEVLERWRSAKQKVLKPLISFGTQANALALSSPESKQVR